MNLKRVIIVVTVLALGIVCFAWRDIARERQVTQRVFGGEVLRNALISSQSVLFARLHHTDAHPGGSEKLADYAHSESLPVPGAQATVIKRLLQDPSSYDLRTDMSKDCIPDYGMLLTFQSLQHTVRVAICFECKQLCTYDGNDDSAMPIAIADFDPAQKQFAAFAKALFPTDSEIQALR